MTFIKTIILFFLLYIGLPFLGNAQSPGGVGTNNNLWLKADVGITTVSGGVSAWSDQSVLLNHASQGTPLARPSYVDNSMNFNPTLNYTKGGTSDRLVGTTADVFTDIFVVCKVNANSEQYSTVFQSTAGADNNNIRINTTGGDWRVNANGAGANDFTQNGVVEVNGVSGYVHNNLEHIIYAQEQTVSGNIRYSIGHNSNNAREFDGSMAEVIAFGANVTATEKSKIHSYLALKYGITLTQDYLASDATVIWNAATNATYNNDVFGIVRDDASALNQKVSKSINADAIITLALDNDFTSSNIDAGRSTTHTNDKQFLVLSNNDAAVTANQTTELPTAYNARIAREWRVSATNFTDAVNMKFTGYGTTALTTYYLVKDADGDFSTGATALGALDANGEITGVTLADGEYITVCASTKSPGGVISNNNLWLKADAGITTVSGGVSAWSDQSVLLNHASQGTALARPSYVDNSMNFNPTLNYSAGAPSTSDRLVGTTADVFSDVFVVCKVDGNSEQYSTVFQNAGAPDDNNIRINGIGGNWRVDANGAGVADFTQNGVVEVNGVSGFAHNNLEHIIYAQEETYSDNITYSIGHNTDNTREFDGSIAEVVAYGENVTATEKSKIHSYLALKYGITLTQDYLASDATVIWNAATNATYNNDVFGIVRDDASALNQKVSKSINADAIITLALDNDFTSSNIDAGRTTTHTNDKQFLVLSNNDGGIIANQITELPTAYNARIDREWRVSATNFTDAVNMKLTGYGTTALTTYYLVKDADGDFSTGATALGALDANGEITGVTLADGEYITVCATTKSPGGVASNNNLWLKADADVDTTATGFITNWYDQSTLLNHADQTTADRRPQYAGNSMNFNPTLKYSEGTGAGSDRLVGTTADVFSDVFVVCKVDANSEALSTVFQNAGAPDDNNIRINGIGGNWRAPGNSAGAADFTENGILEVNGVSGFVHNNLEHIIYAQEETMSGNIRYSIGHNSDNTREFDGSIAEVIAYEANVTATEKSQIHSYLALKYGITLTQDYLASDATVIWNAATNATYNNDVFGVGRDDISNLDQRVSKSLNADAIVTLALDNDFTSSNIDAGRTTAHTNDKQYLILSNDDGGLIPTQTTELPGSGIYNIRVGREWRVSATNFSETVNMKFDGFEATTTLEYFLLKDADGDFTAGATEIGPLNSIGEITGVSLADGDYLAVICKKKYPGGVSTDLKTWFVADDGTNSTTDGANVSLWKDQSNEQLNAYANIAANQPFYQNATGANGFNFHSSILFCSDANKRHLRVDANPAFNAGNRSIYAVSRSAHGTNAQYKVILSRKEGNLWDQGWVTTTSGSDMSYEHAVWDGTRDPEAVYTPYPNNQSFITSAQSVGNVQHLGIDGGTANTSSTGSQTTTPGNPLHIGWAEGNFGFTNYISEIVFFDNDNFAERAKIESYLALKYGITLDQSTAQDYIASDGTTTMWQASANVGYDNDIFGIGRDDASVEKVVSKSINSDAIVTIAMDNDFTSADKDLSRTGTFTNNFSFFTAGNDNASLTEVTTNVPNVGCDVKRLERQWKADLTNFDNSVDLVNLAFDLNGLTITGTTAERFKLVIDIDGDGNFTTGTPIIVDATSFASNIVTFTDVLGFVDGAVFTLITDAEIPTLVVGITTSTTTPDICENAEWLYFRDPSDATKYIASIRLNGNSITHADINVTVDDSNPLTTATFGRASTAQNKAVHMVQRMIQVDCPTCNLTVNGGVDLRLFIDPADQTTAGVLMDALMTANSITGTKQWEWFKSDQDIATIMTGLTFDGIPGSGDTWATADATGIVEGVDYIEFQGIQTFSTFGGGWFVNQGSVFPVELLSFSGTLINPNRVSLEWVTESEINAAYFDVERSVDGSSWNTIGTVSASGNSIVTTYYGLIDESPEVGVNYYRLKQVDTDETYTFSNVIAISINEINKNTLKIYPNPFTKEVFVSGSTSELEAIRIHDLLGRDVTESISRKSLGNTRVLLDFNELPAGVYYIKSESSINTIIKQ